MKKQRIFIKSIYNEFRIFNSPIFIEIKPILPIQIYQKFNNLF